jgi:ribose transport system substrate-binding protein
MKNTILGIFIGALMGIVGAVLWQVTSEKDKEAALTQAPVPVQTHTQTSGQKITIGFSVPGTDHSWLGAIKRNAEVAAQSHPDVELVLTDGLNSSEKQMADIETLIRRKVDVIVMLPHSGKALTPAAKKIYDAGIPLVVLDRKIESEYFYTYIGGDNFGIGQAAARYIGKKLNGSGNVVEVMGLAGISVTTERHQGFIQTLKAEFPKIKLLSSLAADFSADKGLTVTEALLQAHPNINAIYSHDDDMNVGVLRAVMESPRKDEILLTGAGGSKLMFENIKNDNTPVKASFLYNPAMAGSALNIARLIGFNNKMTELWEPEVPRQIIIRASEVTKENADQFMSLGY